MVPEDRGEEALARAGDGSCRGRFRGRTRGRRGRFVALVQLRGEAHGALYPGVALLCRLSGYLLEGELAWGKVLSGGLKVSRRRKKKKEEVEQTSEQSKIDALFFLPLLEQQASTRTRGRQQCISLSLTSVPAMEAPERAKELQPGHLRPIRFFFNL